MKTLYMRKRFTTKQMEYKNITIKDTKSILPLGSTIIWPFLLQANAMQDLIHLMHGSHIQ